MLGYIPNLRITTEGDHALAGMYVGLGKTLLQTLIGTLAGQHSGEQNHRINDNVEIRCKFVGNQRFVHIKAGGCQAYLDSGVVDLGSIAPENPMRYDNGLLYYSDTLATLAADKKLLGLIRPPKTKSEPVVSGQPTAAFRVSAEADGSRDSGKLAAMYLKKIAAAQVPPSIFTGKMRLYVQSLYGASLAQFKDFSPSLTPISAAPWIVYSKGDFTLNLTTNTGIYTSEDHKYFLVTLDGVEQIRITKLTAPPCIDALRSLIDNENTLPADKERIEAYILSQSKPDRNVSFLLDAPHQSGWAMGYGWHFNWSGTAADIVRADIISAAPSGGYKYSSTHYRMTWARNAAVEDLPDSTAAENEQRRWSINVEQIIEGPVDWKVNKWVEVIAYPEWSEPVLSIFGALLGNTINSDAPFYCFYKRDELQVVRSTRTGGGAGTYYEIVSDPPYYYGGNYGPSTISRGWQMCDTNTIGDEAAFSESRTFSAQPTDTRFSVNGAGARVRVANYSYSFHRSSEKVIGQPTEYLWHWDGFVPLGKDADYYVGRPLESHLLFGVHGCFIGYTDGDFYAAYEHIFVPGPCNMGQAYTPVYFEVTSGSGSTTKSGNMLCVVPYYDSEAVYLWAQDIDVVGEVGQRVIWDYVAIYGGWVDHSMCSTLDPKYIRQDQLDREPDFGWVDGIPINFSNQLTYTQTHASLYCSAGVFSFTPPGLSAFFAGESGGSVVQQFFSTHSSTSGDVSGEGIALTGGYPTDLFDSKPATFLGFA